jgi:APA family basic amino acid/polyamine antiporter
MPRGLIGTLIICTVLYVAVCFVLTGMVKYTNLSTGEPLADAFDQSGLGWAGIIIGTAAVAGLTSVILVDIVAMGRIGFALCRDGLLPPAVGRVHPKYNTPVVITASGRVGRAVHRAHDQPRRRDLAALPGVAGAGPRRLLRLRPQALPPRRGRGAE